MFSTLRGTALVGKAGRRLCHTLDVGIASAPHEERSPEFVRETTRPARLWAMQRVTQRKYHLDQAMRAWRIPGCLDMGRDFLPEGVGPLLYLDRLQLHQFFWKLGNPDFLCTKFCMDVYDASWATRHANSSILASFDVYPQRMNKDEDDDIVNIILVSPKQWGLRSPIHFSGEQECIGVRRGGIFKRSLTFLAFECDLSLPAPKILLDVSNLDIGEKVLIEDLNLELELRWSLKPSTVVCEVLPASSSQEVPLVSQPAQDICERLGSEGEEHKSS